MKNETYLLKNKSHLRIPPLKVQVNRYSLQAFQILTVLNQYCGGPVIIFQKTLERLS